MSAKENNVALAMQLLNVFQKQEKQTTVLIELLLQQQKTIQEKDFLKLTELNQKITMVFQELDEVRKIAQKISKEIADDLQIKNLDQKSLAKLIPNAQDISIVDNIKINYLTALEYNKQNTDTIQKLMEHNKIVMKEIQKGKKTAEAYKETIKAAPRFIDDKS